MRRTFNIGSLALVGVGIYFAWQNRFRIQQFLESQGINTPLDTSNMTNTLRSGIAKISGKLNNTTSDMDSVVGDVDSNVRRAV